MAEDEEMLHKIFAIESTSTVGVVFKIHDREYSYFSFLLFYRLSFWCYFVLIFFFGLEK